MATYSKIPYKRVSFKQLENAVKWCQNNLNLRDWKIELEIGNTAPGWIIDDGRIGSSQTYVPYFTAKVWVCPKRCKENDTHPISVLCHEMLHVFFYNYGIEDHDERATNTLEYHLFQNWLNKNKKRKN